MVVLYIFLLNNHQFHIENIFVSLFGVLFLWGESLSICSLLLFRERGWVVVWNHETSLYFGIVWAFIETWKFIATYTYERSLLIIYLTKKVSRAIWTCRTIFYDIFVFLSDWKRKSICSSRSFSEKNKFFMNIVAFFMVYGGKINEWNYVEGRKLCETKEGYLYTNMIKYIDIGGIYVLMYIYDMVGNEIICMYMMTKYLLSYLGKLNEEYICICARLFYTQVFIYVYVLCIIK